jgi:hypothetical protein
MKTPPQCREVLLGRSFPLSGLDQGQMKALRRRADETGKPVLDLIEHGIDRLVANFEAAIDAEARIIQFPRSRRVTPTRKSQ